MKRLWLFIKTRWEEVLFLGIAIQLWVWALTTGDLLLILVVTASLIAMLLLIYAIIEGISKGKRKRTVGQNTAFQVPRRGMIFTVGKQANTILFAIQHQKPTFVGLICTEATQSVAEQVKAESGLNSECVHPRIVDPYAIQEIRTITETQIQWLLAQNLTRGEIVADVTGGLTPLSLGVYSAADDQKVDVQYVRSQYDENNKVIEGTQQGLLIVHFPTA
jgi:hypothetical protein